MTIPRTRAWQSEELVHEKYCYHAVGGELLFVCFPGCVMVSVSQQIEDWLVLDTAQVLRKPQRVRNAGEYI